MSRKIEIWFLAATVAAVTAYWVAHFADAGVQVSFALLISMCLTLGALIGARTARYVAER